MDDPTIAKAVELALNPEIGTPFSYGGKDFKFQYLTAAGEDALVQLLKPRIEGLIARGEESHMQVMAAIKDVLPQAMAIILSDYDPSIDETWVRAVRGRGLNMKMYDVVAAQFEVNELGKLLSGLLQTDALLSALTSIEA